MKPTSIARGAACLMVLGLAGGLGGCTDTVVAVVTAPVTLAERVVEARSSGNIAKDNEIVLDVNAIMADLGTIKASTEIYEQRLLITGLFDDKKLYNDFRRRVGNIYGIKKLYWHVMYMSKAAQAQNKARLIAWPDAMLLDNRVGLKLVGAAGVADVNFRVAADAKSTIYLIGRARSGEERRKALALARGTSGVKRVVNYVVVRP